MAAPETQFGQAGITIPAFTPVETKLNPPIQLPGTGELWAQVGRTALEAGKQIQSSALNPAVRAQMQYAVKNYQYAQEHIDWLKSKGDYGQMTTGIGPGGAEAIPGGTTGINTMVAMGLMNQPAGGGGGGAGGGRQGQDVERSEAETAPVNPVHPTDIQTDEQGNKTYFDPATGNWKPLQGLGTEKQPSAPAAPTKKRLKPSDRPAHPTDLLTLNTQVPSRGGSTAALSAGPGAVLNTGQPQSADIEAVPAAQYRAQQQGGSIWSPQAPAPMAPPAPTGAQPEADQTPGSAISQVTQQPGVALANWQAQNVHPVIAPKAVLDAVRTNVSTAAQDATYLPNGGVNGEPAWAIHMRGGGQTTISASQLASSPWGRSLMATHNASEVMEAQNQPQQQPAAAPGGQPTPEQLANLPTTPPQQPYQPLDYRTGQPPAAPGTAYNAAAYQMPQGPTITQTGEVNPVLMAGGTNEQAAAAANQPPVPNVQGEVPTNRLKGYSRDELSKMEEDPDVGSFAGFNWRQDRDDGRFYSTMKSGASTLREQRNYWGSPGWQDMPMDNSDLRQALRDVVKTQRGITFSDVETRDMPIADVKFWLDEAKYLEKTGGDPSGHTALHILGTIQQSQSLARQIAMLEAAKKEGIDPHLFNTGAQTSSEESSKREETLPPAGQEYPAFNALGLGWGGPSASWDLGWAAVHGARTTRTGGRISPLADKFRSEINYFTDVMGQTPGLKYSTGGKPEEEPVSVEGQAWQGGPSGRVHIPSPTELSTLKEINRISAGGNIDDMIKGTKDLKAKIDQNIKDSVDLASRLNFRTPPSFKKTVEALNNNQNIEDKHNEFIDSSGNPQMPEGYKHPPGMQNIPEDKGKPEDQVEQEMQRFYGNRPRPPVPEFDTMEDATKFTKTKPSGTYFKYKGHQYMVE